MRKQVYEIDGLGFLKEIYVKEFDEQGNCLEKLTENIITVDPPNGLYQPKWTGTEWISTMTELEYIASLNNQPQKLTESEQRLLDLETAMTQILGGTV